MSMGATCFYEGTVRHRRRAPLVHEFQYPIFMLYADLAELPHALDDLPLWSARGPAVVRFAREDYLGPPEEPLESSVRSLVHERTGVRPDGPIRLLTHPRWLGYVINPVSFYYCFDRATQALTHVVAHVTNTPWGEDHVYCFDRRAGEGPRKLAFSADKEMHVSPFMSMDQRYGFRFTEPGDGLSVHIENHQDGERLFDATLTVRRRAATGREALRAVFRHPLQTARVAAGIYGQALRLRLAGAPFHPHPDSDRRLAWR